MTLAEWDDGYVLDTDPRREDPLYYYMPRGAWDQAVGFEVTPLYREHEATEIVIRVFSKHQAQEAIMPGPDKARMYRRVVPALIKRYPKWSTVSLNADQAREVLADGSIQAAFRTAGFGDPDQVAADQLMWRKA